MVSAESAEAPQRVTVTLQRSGFLTRRSCLICGSWTEKDEVLAVVEGIEAATGHNPFAVLGPYVVCADCLAEGPAEAGGRLRGRAEYLEARARYLRGLAGADWRMPSLDDWRSANGYEIADRDPFTGQPIVKDASGERQ